MSHSAPIGSTTPPGKWGKRFWSDLAERVGSVLGYGIVVLLTTSNITDVDPEVGWTIVGLPTALAFLKGLLANAAHPESGASLLPSPPGPEVNQA